MGGVVGCWFSASIMCLAFRVLIPTWWCTRSNACSHTQCRSISTMNMDAFLTSSPQQLVWHYDIRKTRIVHDLYLWTNMLNTMVKHYPCHHHVKHKPGNWIPPDIIYSSHMSYRDPLWVTDVEHIQCNGTPNIKHVIHTSWNDPPDMTYVANTTKIKFLTPNMSGTFRRMILQTPNV